MRNLGLSTASALAALMLAGCGGLELQNAESLSAPGDTFDKGLYTGYVDLAKSEYAESDYRDSDTFAVRAARISGGEIVGPEEISTRALPEGAVVELSDARKRLVAALISGAREKAPAGAANAQVMFDCWMQEQEENFQPEDIARCRGGFMTAMAKIDETMKPAPRPVAARPATPIVAKQAQHTAPKPARRIFVVYFPFDSDKITPTSRRVILNAIDAAKSMGAKRVAVSGHTDTAGPKRYNTALAEARTRAVANALAKGGFEEGRMNLGSFGEALPAVATGDGVRYQQNRRAVIEISQ